MDRVYQANVSQSPTKLVGYQAGYPQGATPSSSATVPGPYWYYAVTEEFRNAILAGGVVPDALETNQLATAISAIASQVATQTVSPYTSQIASANTNAAAAVVAAQIAANVPASFADGSDTTKGGSLVAAPFGVNYTALGSVGNRLMGQAYTPEEQGAKGDGFADDRSALQSAINYCLSNGIKELASARTFAVSGPVDISNFAAGFRLRLGGLVAHSSFPAVPTYAGGWKFATPMLSVGTVGGSQVGLNVDICNVDGGGKADVVWITNNGCGGSRFHFDRVRNANIITKLTGNTAPTASNYLTGSYWESSTLGGLVHGGTTVCEGTTFDVGFISGCKYGGLVFGDGSQYANVRGQLDFNGQWLTEMQVNSLTGFTIGDQVNNASGGFAEVLSTYTYQGRLYILLIETKNTSGGLTNFAINNNLTNGAAVTAIVGIRTANQNGDNRFFDVVSALTSAAPFWRAMIITPYLGGIVGSLLHSAKIFSGNSNSSFTDSINGLEVYNSGTILSLADKRASDQSFMDITDAFVAPRRDVYLGGNKLFGIETTATLVNTAIVDVLTLPAPVAGGHGAVWLIAAINPNDAAMRCKGTVCIAAGATAGSLVVDWQTNVTLTISGLTIRIAQGTGADKPMYLTATRCI